jgi:hypothetical protein
LLVKRGKRSRSTQTVLRGDDSLVVRGRRNLKMHVNVEVFTQYLQATAGDLTKPENSRRGDPRDVARSGAGGRLVDAAAPR